MSKKDTRNGLLGDRPSPTMAATAAASGALMMLAAGLASAQQAPGETTSSSTDQVDEITVVGVRAAVESAINVKKNSDEIVEAVSAEDIGKLPDTSIAESISRLPGLTSQRSDGRASDISIRGLDPQFATATLNGREQVSTGDNRSVEFDQYPAELISQVVVYKTPQANLIGQGLAGTIALETTRPLEYGKRTLHFDVRGEKNSDANLGADSGNNGYRGSVSYIDQFFDNTLGVTLGFARLDSPIVGKEYGTYDPWSPNGTTHAGIDPNAYTTAGIKSLASMGTSHRDGSLGTIEWKPNDHFTSTLDTYYTKAELDNNRRSLEVNIGNYNGLSNGTAVYSNPVYSDGSLIGATVSNVVPLARNFDYITRDQIFAAGWNNKWKADTWSVMGDLSFSRATRDEKDYETQAQFQNGVTDTMSYFLPQGSMPSFTVQNGYTNPSQVLVGPTIYGAGYSRFPHVEDKLKSARLEGTHDAGWWFSDVVVGANYDDRTKDKVQPETGLSTIGNQAYQIAPQYLLPPTNLGFSGTASPLSWNVPGVLAAYFQPVVPTTDAGYLVGKTWNVTEKLTTVYLKGDLNHDLSPSVSLRGNVGVQVIHTDQSSTSGLYNPATNAVTPNTDGTTYNDVLPSANLVFQFPNQQDLRVGIAKEVARPRMDQMANAIDYGVASNVVPGGTATSLPGATAGNPRLAPWRADSFDLSYEKYFDNKAYLSATGFFKKLKTYIYDQTINYDFSALNSLLTPQYIQQQLHGVPPQQFGPLTIPLNGNGGRLDGVELTASAPFDMISEYLSGFGGSVSLSETDSSVRIPGQIAGGAAQNITLPGLSKTVWSAMLYYEKSGFSARVASRYRSNYVGEITDFAGDRSLEYVRHELITDFQTSYEFQGGPLKNLMLLLQINNMTNTPFIDYVGDQARVRDYETFGRDVFFGFNYKIL